MVRIASSAPSTPSTPSNLPPVGWVSRCEPMAIGTSELLRPGRSANMLPTASTVTLQPKASHCLLNQSRTFLSSSDNVSRLMPPFGVAPNCAVSMIWSHKRLGLIVRLLAMLSLQKLDHLRDLDIRMDEVIA